MSLCNWEVRQQNAKLVVITYYLILNGEFQIDWEYHYGSWDLLNSWPDFCMVYGVVSIWW